MGFLKSLTGTLMRLARKGDVEAFRAYVRSDAFLADLIGIDPDRRQSALRCHARAEALCEAKARHPLVKPRPIDASRAHKVDWKNDAGMRAKLTDAYARAGGNDEKAARILGVSLGSARLAKKRHLPAAATDLHEKAP
jgi:hypothetical protein